MNAKTVLAIAATAIIGSAAASSSSSSDACSSSQQTSAYTTLASLLTLDSFQGCVDDSGYSLLYSTSLPTDAEYVKMCASSDCQSLIESIIALNPPDWPGGERLRAGQRLLEHLLVAVERLVGQHQHDFNHLHLDDVHRCQYQHGHDLDHCDDHDGVGSDLDGCVDRQRCHDRFFELDGDGHDDFQLGLHDSHHHHGYGLLNFPEGSG